MSDFKERLAKAMAAKKINQATLSSITKIPKSAISQYLKGYFKPRAKRLDTICAVLEISPAWLMGYNGVSDGDVHGLTKAEIRVISAYRRNPNLRQSIDALVEFAESDKNVFRAAKSDDGTIPPTYETMSPDELKRLFDAPETDADI